jgi:hypothetical protein
LNIGAQIFVAPPKAKNIITEPKAKERPSQVHSPPTKNRRLIPHRQFKEQQAD